MNDNDLKREAERIVNEICETFDEKFITDQFIDVVFNALRSVRDKALEEAKQIVDAEEKRWGRGIQRKLRLQTLSEKIESLKSKAGEVGNGQNI